MNVKTLPGKDILYPLMADWVDPRAGLETLEKRKFFATAGN